MQEDNCWQNQCILKDWYRSLEREMSKFGEDRRVYLWSALYEGNWILSRLCPCWIEATKGIFFAVDMYVYTLENLIGTEV